MNAQSDLRACNFSRGRDVQLYAKRRNCKYFLIITGFQSDCDSIFGN